MILSLPIHTDVVILHCCFLLAVARTDPSSLAIVNRLFISGYIYPKIWGKWLTKKLKREANIKLGKEGIPTLPGEYKILWVKENLRPQNINFRRGLEGIGSYLNYPIHVVV